MMTRQKPTDEPLSISTEEVQRWYTAGEGAKVLSKKSGRTVRPSYLSKLGSLNKIRTKKIHDRLVLYSKEDVDGYTVEPRGAKSGEAMREKYSKTGPTVRESRKSKRQD